MDVILSIKPEFAQSIADGKKKFEFRKVIFKKKNVKKVFVYRSEDIKKIIGVFDIGGIIADSPKNLWKKCSKHGGISKKSYDDYFKNKDRAFAIKIANFEEKEFDPREAMANFCPPQSFQYVESGFFSGFI